MGFTPRVVDTMTLWELSACWHGFRKANYPDPDGDKPAAPTPEKYYDMLKRLKPRTASAH